MKAEELKSIQVPAPYSAFEVIVNKHVPPGEVWVVQTQRPGCDYQERILIINNLGVFRAHEKWRHRCLNWIIRKLTHNAPTLFVPNADDVPT